jgi:hypothetical protein
MARRNTCNELISADQRALVLQLYTETNRTLNYIARTTGVPVAKVKSMVANSRRPKATEGMTTEQRNTLLMQW